LPYTNRYTLLKHMKFIEAQEDMFKSYFGGGSGAFASGVVWIS